MKKKIFSIVLSAAIFMASSVQMSVSAFAADESVIATGAGLETIYVEWNGTTGTNYTVSYKEAGSEDVYKAIDAELVREVEPGQFRADVLGLKGDVAYSVKVENGGTVVTEFRDTPKAHDRSGFAFDNDNAPGAYNMDGTLPDNALVIYVTNDNVRDVYNGMSLNQVFGNINKINDGNPVDIRFIGKIDRILPNTFQVGMFYDNCGVTLEGVGPESGFNKWGMNIEYDEDIEIRNLIVVDPEEDAFGFYRTKKMWFHNNTIYSGYAPLDDSGEQDKLHGDGSVDMRECDRVTISYNHFAHTDKTSLMGSSPSRVEPTGSFTFHHNFFEETGQRTPRVRWHNVHLYNNYYYGTEVYAVAATNKADIFAENNYFEDAASPFLISAQSEFTSKFSTNDGGAIKAYNNKFVNTREFVEGLDYFNAPSREYRLTPDDFTAIKGGWTYNNFDAEGYIGSNDYMLDDVDKVKDIVLENAGATKDTGINITNKVTPPIVKGEVTAKYYYDSAESGTTGASYGGENGTGSFFNGEGTCKAGTTEAYFVADKHEYSGCFNTNSAISFTTKSPAKLKIVAGAATEVPVRAVVTNESNPDAVYHGTFQTGYHGGVSLSTVELTQAGTYSFVPPAEMDIYYIEVSEYDTSVVEK